MAGCVPSAGGAALPVAEAIDQRLGTSLSHGRDEPARLNEARQLAVSQPLDAANAVRIAFALNPRVRAQFDWLDIVASERMSAAAIAPLEVHVEATLDSRRAIDSVGVDLTQDLLNLFQRGQRQRVAGAELHAAQARTVSFALVLAAEVERAYLDVVASHQTQTALQATFETARASAEIAQRQHEAGNIPDLALLREQAQRDQAGLDLQRARADLANRRERLNVAMGLGSSPATWTITADLPPVPAEAPALADFERAAATSNLELAALASEQVASRGRGAIARTRGWLPYLGLGLAADRDADAWSVGPALRVGIPLFDRQGGARARAKAEGSRAQHAALALTGEIAACARIIRADMILAYDEAKVIDDVVLPMRRKILEETLLHYNAMNASPFEVLVARRDVSTAELQLVQAKARFWKTSVDARTMTRGAIACRQADEPTAARRSSVEIQPHD